VFPPGDYDCSYNLYRGSLRGDPFVGLDALESVVLSGNHFNSSVPNGVSTLPSLTRLYIEGAFLTGSLGFVTNMNLISELSLDFNNIQGRIPSRIGLLSNLVSVSLSDNELTGRIPSEIGNLSLLGECVLLCIWARVLLFTFTASLTFLLIECFHQNNCHFTTTH
jgi:hypothetical protein